METKGIHFCLLVVSIVIVTSEDIDSLVTRLSSAMCRRIHLCPLIVTIVIIVDVNEVSTSHVCFTGQKCDLERTYPNTYNTGSDAS